jgi:glycosyltransferase involved in cell wall biosynthesis
MKILHIITGLFQGGAESALFRLTTTKFNEPSVTHIVVSMLDSGIYGQYFRDHGIEVYALNMKQGAISLQGLYKLWSLIRKVNPDIVQTWMYHSDLLGGIAARLAGKRCVWGIVNFNLSPSIASRSTRWTAKACAILSNLIPTKIISCSAQAVLSHQAIGYSKKLFITIPLGYDLDEFKRNEKAGELLRKSWGLSSNTIVIGFLARWNVQKDHANMLRAFSILRSKYTNSFCVFAGPGMEESNADLKKIIDQTDGGNERLILAGRVNSIPEIMSAFDLHVLPSLGEAFPNVVAEAMACGTPCIVTDVGDAATIVDKIGWVVPPANSIALANAIDQAILLMDDKKLWDEKVDLSRKRIVENYSMSRMIDSYYDIWRSIIATRKHKK